MCSDRGWLPAVMFAISVLALGATVAAQECEVTNPEELFPSVVAPVAGEHPVWAVGGGSAGAPWCCPDCAHKTLWIAARSQEGDLVIRGRRLDGGGEAQLRGGALPRSDELVIHDAHAARGAIPGGATREILREYSFWPSHVFYPSPGCWVMIADYGGLEVRIFQRLEDESKLPGCQKLIRELERRSESGAG